MKPDDTSLQTSERSLQRKNMKVKTGKSYYTLKSVEKKEKGKKRKYMQQMITGLQEESGKRKMNQEKERIDKAVNAAKSDSQSHRV